MNLALMTLSRIRSALDMLLEFTAQEIFLLGPAQVFVRFQGISDGNNKEEALQQIMMNSVLLKWPKITVSFLLGDKLVKPARLLRSFVLSVQNKEIKPRRIKDQSV